MLQRKHFCTQQLFHLQPKPIKSQSTTDQRHADDSESVVMKYFIEGNPHMHSEAKGLRHDCMGWEVQGNPQVKLSNF